MSFIYNKTNWQNKPSNATPINARNLNNLENGVEAAAQAVNEHEAALALKANAADVDDIIKQVTGCSRVEIGRSGYITTDEPISLEPTPHSKWRCEIISCSAGEVFTVRSKGDSHKLAWVFLDENDSKLPPSAPPNTSIVDAVITAPAGAVKLVINANVNPDGGVEPYCFRGKLTVKSIEDIINALVLKANTADVASDLAKKASTAEMAQAQSALGEEKFALIRGGYIVTAPDVSESVTEDDNWSYIDAACAAGQSFLICAKGSSSNRAWTFVDTNNNRKSYSASTTDVITEQITAPSGTTRLIVNNNHKYNPDGYCFRGSRLADRVNTVELTKANSADMSAALALKANAAEVYTKTETDTALAKKVNAAEVDYTITKITGCPREEIGKSGYITTDEPITSLEPTPHSKWRCEVISCEPGDVFTVYTKGDSHKLAWVFLDNSNAKLTPSAKPNTDVNDAVITAPVGAVKLVINANVNSVEPYCFRGNLTDILSSLALKANSSDIPSKTSDLTNDSGFIAAHQNDLPSYYDDYLADKIDEINEIIDGSGDDGDTFIFITDYHRQSNIKNSPALIRRIMDWTNLKKIVFGGDAQDYETTAGAAIAVNDGFKADFEKLWDRMYNIIGNHEFNSHHGAEATLTQQQIKLFFIRPQSASYGAVNTYGDYWVDNVTQKIRYFFIGCKKNSTIDKEQLKWLFNEFLSVPADYLIIVFSHLTFKPVDTNDTNNTNDTKPIFVQGNVSTIARMMTEYNQRNDSASVTFNYTDEYDVQQSETVSYNYGSAGAWCAAIIGGHTHYDADTSYEKLSDINGNLITWNYVPVIATTTDAEHKQQDNTGALTRTAGTVSEQAFDVIHIDRANHKLIFKRIGAGADREITYSAPSQSAQSQGV